MMKTRLILLINACLVFSAIAQDSASVISSGEERFKIIVAKPVDASPMRNGRDEWFAGLTEQLFHFRLAVSEKFSMVPSAKVNSYLSDLGAGSTPNSGSAYERLARQIGATHVLLQTFEISRDGRNVHYYTELRSFGKESSLQPFEREFPIQSLNRYIDSCVVWIYEQNGMEIDSNLQRFFSLNVLSEGKDNRLMGQLSGAAVGNDKEQAGEILPQLTDIVDRDPRNIFAQYLAAQALETAGEHLAAANVYKDLIMVLPNYNNLYVKACRNYRLSGRNREALSYAADAEGRGVRSLDLMIEGGLALEAQERYKRAKNVFQSVLDAYPSNTEALLFFARFYNHENDPEKAIEFSEKILKKSPENGRALLQKGIAQVGQKKYKEAASNLEKAQIALPRVSQIGTLLGKVYTNLEKYELAARSFAQVALYDPQDFGIQLQVGRSWIKASKPSEAMDAFLRAERMFADSVILKKEIGLLAADMGDTSKAVTYLESYLDKGSMDSEVLMRLGDIYTEKGVYDKAFYMYNHAMSVVEDKNTARFALGSFYIRKGDPNAAITYLQDIIKENPKYSEVQRLVADAYFAAGNHSEALSHYHEARKQDGSDVHIQRRIARINFEASEYATAEREYLKLLRQNEKDSGAYFYLAIISLHNKNLSKAQSRLSQANEQGTATAQILYLLGQGFEIVDRTDEAISFYNRCLKKDSGHENAQLSLARAYEKTGENKLAAQSYSKLFEMDTVKYADYLAEAGLHHEKAGEPEKARDAFSRYLNGGYENPEINLHLARLEFGFKSYARVISLIGELEKQIGDNEGDIRILAESYFRTSDYTNAIDWFKRIVDDRKAGADVIEMTAVSYEKTSNIATAREYYQKLLPKVEEKRKPDIAFHIAELYESQRMIRDAQKQYLDNVGLYPSDLRNYDRLLAIFKQEGEWNEARRVLEKLVGKPYSKPGYTKELARVCLHQNDKSNAIKYFKEYLEDRPDDFEGWYVVGKLYSERRLFAKASQALQHAVRLDGSHFDAHLLYGEALKETGETVQAASVFEKANEIDGKHAGVVTHLAQCYRKLGDKNALINTLEKLIALEPQHYGAHVELGNLLIESGKEDEGIAVLENAWKLDKKDVSVHITLARLYEKRNNQNARFSHLKKASSRDNKVADVHYELGRFYLHEKNQKRAERFFKKALDIDGDNAEVCYAYGSMLFDMERYKESFTYLETAARRDGYNPDYLVGYARAAYENGKKDLALKVTEKALSADEQHVDALSFAGRLYRENGHARKAHDMLLRAIAHDSNRPEIYHQLGELALAEEEYTKASGFFKRSLEVGGYREESIIGLGRILILTCKDEKARELFEEVLSRNGEQKEAFYRLTHLYIRGGFINEAKQIIEKRRNEKKTAWHHLAFGEWAEVEGDYQAAKISYTVALRLMGKMPEAYAGLGRVNLNEKDYNTAIENFARAQALDPYNPYLFLDMGKAYEGIGELGSAYNIYTNVAEKFPHISEAFYRIAGIIGRKNQHDKALAIVKEGLQNNPRDAKLYFAMGESYRHLGKYEEAIEAYSQAVKRGGKGYIEGLLHIGNIYNRQLRNEKEAKKYFKKYIRSGGNNEEAKKQLDELAKI